LPAVLALPYFVLALAAAPVSYSREVAPILAFHCYWCHGNRREVPAGDFDARNYASLMKGGGLGDVIRPGNPDRSLLVQFLEGKRGADHRMPLKADPLPPRDIATIRRWIAEGAREDAPAARYILTARGVRLDPAHEVEIFCTMPVRGYISARIASPAGSLLLTEEGPVAWPKGSHNLDVPGATIHWQLWPEQYWPRTVNVTLEIAWPERDPAAARLTVKSGRQEIRVAGPHPL
jgi:hypothetical protein